MYTDSKEDVMGNVKLGENPTRYRHCESCWCGTSQILALPCEPRSVLLHMRVA